MAKKAKRSSRGGHELPSKKNAPKRTGKSGIGPGPDREGTAPTGQPSMSMAEQEAAVSGTNAAATDKDQTAIDAGRESAKERNEEESKQAEAAVAGKKKGPKQGQLLRIPKQPSPAIQNEKMGAHFIGFRAHRLKNRTKVVTMRFSVILGEDHEGHLPKTIEDEWKHFRRGSVKLTQPEGIGTQNVTLSIAADKHPDLDITATVPKALISKVQVKGQGAARKVTRLEIHLLTTYTADVDRFCRNTYDESVWVTLEETQASMEEEAAEAEE